MFEKLKDNIQNFDFLLFLGMIIAALTGILLIKSASMTYTSGTRYVIVQTAAFALGLVLCILISFWDYEFLSAHSKYLFALNIFLLVLVLVIGIGREEVGGNSWISLGPVSFQPSEIVKIIYIICFAAQLSKAEDDDINRPGNILMFLAHAGIILILILLQPDFGTAMVFAAVFFGMLFTAGLSFKYIAGAAIAGAGIIPLVWMFLLKSYQKDRIMVFLNPELDPMVSGYQVIQSKIAVGSGGFGGMGLFKGIQTQLGYIPAKHTDFIFAVAGEELGFIGSVFIVAILIFIVFRCFYVAANAKNSLGRFIAVGVGCMFLAQSFENIGMTIGIMPVTGITLPFFSYGGSSLITNMIAIGLVQNVYVRRKTLNF